MLSPCQETCEKFQVDFGIPSARFLTLVCSLSLAFCTCHSLSSACRGSWYRLCLCSLPLLYSDLLFFTFHMPASLLVFLLVRNLLSRVMCLLTDISVSSLTVGSSCAVLSSVPSTWSLVLEIVVRKCVPLGWICLFIHLYTVSF